MLFLSVEEKRDWKKYAEDVLDNVRPPGHYDEHIRRNLVPAFHYYIATLLAAKGYAEQSLEWLGTGSRLEGDGLYSCGHLRGFLERHDHRLVTPSVVFRDPRPFVHFSGVPVMKESRRQFVRHCGHSLPAFDEPIRCMDIGCGDGGLTADLLSHLVEIGKVPGLCEVLLIDPSPAMLDLATETIGASFPDATISIENCRIQDCSKEIDHPFDIAVSSFAYHHMPLEQKRIHLDRLKPWIDHFLLFEIDANNDTPELFSPDLSLSLYQAYGRIIDFIFSHDAPLEVLTDSVDLFLMTELVSMFTQPRGIRSDYHMLRSQWNALFQKVLYPEFSLRCDSTTYADEYMTMFTLHYGRDR
jgi:SAM-dependent methyltransferase